MKKNTIILAIFTAIFTGGILFSQETEELDEISLPDVSTVISGGAPKVGKSAISDFSDVLPSSDSETEDFIPRLPETSETGTLNSDAVLKTSPEKSIYVEGLAGGGFPGFFLKKDSCRIKSFCCGIWARVSEWLFRQESFFSVFRPRHIYFCGQSF